MPDRPAHQRAVLWALQIAGVGTLIVNLRLGIEWLFDSAQLTFSYWLTATLGAFVFCFVAGLALDLTREKAVDNLHNAFTHDGVFRVPLRGFIAMEHDGLFSNRSYIVVANEEGLFGWKFQDTVSSKNDDYFQPFATLLHNPDYRVSLEDLRTAANDGGFHIPIRLIRSIDYEYKKLWRMGEIPHTGVITINMLGGKKRNLILLGRVNGEKIQARVKKILGLIPEENSVLPTSQ